MAKDICIFKRTEKKYMVSACQREQLLEEIKEKLTTDKHGSYTICSLYLDTPTHLLIRNSIDAKKYKEKLRLRSYGTPQDDSRIFFELKKKFEGIVYKRRVSMSLNEAKKYIHHGIKPFDSQIMAEIDYAMQYYGSPKPSMVISYDREAFYAKENKNLRLTFDSNLRYGYENPSLNPASAVNRLLDTDTYILEIKSDTSMPLWLTSALDRHNILPTSFSKYGTAYKKILSEKKIKGEFDNAINF